MSAEQRCVSPCRQIALLPQVTSDAGTQILFLQDRKVESDCCMSLSSHRLHTNVALKCC